MAAKRHLCAVPKPATGSAEPQSPAGVPTAEALASFLRHLASRRGRSGRITSPETVRSYTSALPVAFAGIAHLGELTGPGRDRLHTNIRTAWGNRAPATFNAKRAAVASALSYFQKQGWISGAGSDTGRAHPEHQPKTRRRHRVRDREQIDRLIADKRRPLRGRHAVGDAVRHGRPRRGSAGPRRRPTSTARNRRARTRRKGGKADELLYDVRTARMLGPLLGRRIAGPMFLSSSRRRRRRHRARAATSTRSAAAGA